ncbi:MAG TPA: peptide chain release factor 2 [Elusimicrobia bacterium]|nr:peptide chain release factor 2 [Elusimicrobiota bacterium]
MLNELREKMAVLWRSLDFDAKKAEIASLENKISLPDFWNNQSAARETMSRLTLLKKSLQKWENIQKEIDDARTLRELLAGDNDENALKEIELSEAKILKDFRALEIEAKLSGEHDISNAIVSIHAGAGGTESCDWADMLLRLYVRWSERKGFKVNMTDILPGDEAGTKSVTFVVSGEYAYGLLQSELGVHRLVRVSPFDANKRRHTSFASVDVIPEIEDDVEIKIEDKDLRIDTYRSSGAGGQHVNKTESAIRITHLPTGIVVACQIERSQMKNRATAFKLLRAQLYELEQDKKRQSVEKHYDEKGSIAWGNQIRSYVFMPYQLVKDHRTGAEVPQVDLVMDGEIDAFIEAFLDWKLAGKPKRQ